MKEICIPDGFAKTVLDFLNTEALSECESEMAMILCPTSRNDGFLRLKEKLGADPQGVKIFAAEITAAARAYESYEKLGIPYEIYLDTMRAFRRQLDESYTEQSGWVFDRGSWDVNHTSMSLFRIGELEYAFDTKYGEDVIAVHIPSDANLTDEKMDESFAKAQDFFAKHYPAESGRRITCGTWLLSPTLTEILPAGSKILKFQSRFHIEFKTSAEGCLRWVFGITGKSLSDIDLDTLPEATSLQRSIKSLFKNGGSVGGAYGFYNKDSSVGNPPLGKYRHYKGGEYELIGTAKHSETLEPLIVYKALYSDGGLWVRPAYMWEQTVKIDGVYVPRFKYIGE